VYGGSGGGSDEQQDSQRPKPQGTRQNGHAGSFADLTAQNTMAAVLRMSLTAAPRILVVDDTPALLDVIRKCLEQEGYCVRTCLESRNAVELAKADPPDVIMLDVVMPEVSGWEVLARLRQYPAFQRTPVIVCTAYVAEALGRLAELKGPDQHLGLLPKPFELEELIEVVASVTSATLSS
jgi:CheY-like chemotaxis protein